MFVPSSYVKFLILGSVCLSCALFIAFALPPMIDYYIDKQIALTPQSQSYPKWKTPPVPIYQKFYFFNVSNAQQIEQFGAKPLLEEIGPFTYRSYWSKEEIQNDLIKNTITFKHHKHWQFEPDLSITDHRLQLVTLNAPLAVTLTLIQSASSAVRLLVTFSLDGLSEGFFTKRSVKQLLFDGYPDLLTTFGPLLNAEMLSQGGHFGYMNARNNTIDGTYEINTGADDIKKLNTINRFNGRTKIPHWSHHHAAGQQWNQCDSLEGATTGDMFPPMRSDDINYDSVLRMFQPDFCRVWPLKWDSKSERRSGLRLHRFKASRDVFRNSSDYPENSCYFKQHKSNLHPDPAITNRVPDPSRSVSSSSSSSNNNNNSNHHRQSSNNHTNHHRQSSSQTNNRNPRQQQQQQQQQHHNNNRVRLEWPAGVFTLAPCKFNAPIYMSMPHFMDADPFFAAHVDGLQPDPNRHEFFVDLEPRTGSPVTLAARVQLNVAISKPPGLVRFRNVPEIMFPVFWQELTVNLTGPVIDELLLASRLAQETPIKVSYILAFLGAVILMTVLLSLLRSTCQTNL